MALCLLYGQNTLNKQLALVAVANFSGGIHHQVFGTLGHGEGNNLTDVF
jgi:hypothetical protein